MTDQAVAGNDVESTSAQLSATSGAVQVTQVETVSDGNAGVSHSEEMTSVATVTQHAGSASSSVSAADVSKRVNRIDQLPDNDTKQRCAAVDSYFLNCMLQSV